MNECEEIVRYEATRGWSSEESTTEDTQVHDGV